MAETEDDDPDPVVRLIREIRKTEKTAAKISTKVWEILSPTQREKLGRASLRRIVAFALRNPDPSQMEFAIDGDPFPLDEITKDDLPLLRERGYRLIKMGKSAIRRGEAYLAEYDRRMADKKRGG